MLETAARHPAQLLGSRCERAAFLLTCDETGRAASSSVRSTDEFICFVDPDRDVVKALGLSELPAFVHIALDLTIVGTAEGWDPETWRPIAENLADVMSWSRPQIPKPGDPVPFEGTAALV